MSGPKWSAQKAWKVVLEPSTQSLVLGTRLCQCSEAAAWESPKQGAKEAGGWAAGCRVPAGRTTGHENEGTTGKCGRTGDGKGGWLEHCQWR